MSQALYVLLYRAICTSFEKSNLLFLSNFSEDVLDPCLLQVRKQPHIQELREYQRQMREEGEDIGSKVSDFWSRHEARSESRASARSQQRQSPKEN